jgi:hypothetical protein
MLPGERPRGEISSAKLTRKIPTAAGRSRKTSPSPGIGMSRSGMPLGTLPVTETPLSSRSSRQETPIAPTTTSSAAGKAGDVAQGNQDG